MWQLIGSSLFVSSLEPEWAAAASAVKDQTGGRVRLGAVDATVHQGVASRYGVSESDCRASLHRKFGFKFLTHISNVYEDI